MRRRSRRSPRRRPEGRAGGRRPLPPGGGARSPPAAARRARCGTPRIRSATSCRGHLRELGHELIPALAVALRLVVAEAGVPEPDARASVDRLELPLDGRAPRLVDLAVALPAPGVHDAPAGIELDELAARDVAADADAVEAARARL